jgi:hypothetical protein
MLRKIHGTNFIHRKFMGRISIKCQNGPVLPPAQVFYFNGQALNGISLMWCLGQNKRIPKHFCLSSMDVVNGD